MDTPILGQGASTDIHLESFDTGYRAGNGGTPAFCAPRRSSGTNACWRGLGDCYELPAFRNGEFGRRQPRFTLLEWYRLGWAPGS